MSEKPKPRKARAEDPRPKRKDADEYVRIPRANLDAIRATMANAKRVGYAEDDEEIRPLDPAELDRVREVFAGPLADWGVEFRSEGEEERDGESGPSVRLAEILGTLCNAAVKAAEAGKLHLAGPYINAFGWLGELACVAAAATEDIPKQYQIKMVARMQEDGDALSRRSAALVFSVAMHCLAKSRRKRLKDGPAAVLRRFTKSSITTSREIREQTGKVLGPEVSKIVDHWALCTLAALTETQLGEDHPKTKQVWAEVARFRQEYDTPRKEVLEKINAICARMFSAAQTSLHILMLTELDTMVQNVASAFENQAMDRCASELAEALGSILGTILDAEKKDNPIQFADVLLGTKRFRVFNPREYPGKAPVRLKADGTPLSETERDALDDEEFNPFSDFSERHAADDAKGDDDDEAKDPGTDWLK